MPSYKDQLYSSMYDEATLAHHGIKGQKWGVRRFQNEDGTRTEAGKRRDAKLTLKSDLRQARKDYKQSTKSTVRRADERNDQIDRAWDRANSQTKLSRKTGQINRKQANQQYDATTKSMYKKYKDADKEYVRERKMDTSQYHKDRANAYNKAAKSMPNKTIWDRASKDELSGKAIRETAKSDLAKAKATNNKAAAKKAKSVLRKSNASRVVFGGGTGDQVVGAYKRYRDKGQSKTKSLLKATTIGSWDHD